MILDNDERHLLATIAREPRWKAFGLMGKYQFEAADGLAAEGLITRSTDDGRDIQITETGQQVALQMHLIETIPKER